MPKKLLIPSFGCLFVIALALVFGVGEWSKAREISEARTVILEEPLPVHPLTRSGQTVYYYDDTATAVWVWTIPDAYNDDYFNTRFSVAAGEVCTLTASWILMYGDFMTGTPDMQVLLWDDDGSGFPGTLLDQVTVPYSALPTAGFGWVAADWTTNPHIFVGPAEFHIGWSTVQSGPGDTLCCVSDQATGPHSNTGEERCSEFWAGMWGTMLNDWGYDVCFFMEVELCCEDSEWDNHKMHHPQLPDETGWDVNATQPLVLADDWECSESGYIRDIHFWGSWRNGIEGVIDSFILSIHNDIPAYVDPLDTCWADGDCNCDGTPLSVADMVHLIRIITGEVTAPPCGWFRCDMNGDCQLDMLDAVVFENYFTAMGMAAFDPYGGYPVETCCDSAYSMPDDTIWVRSITDFDTTHIWATEEEGWYDPYRDERFWNDHGDYFRYDVYLDADDWFWQDSGIIYWLNITAFVEDTTTQWGWKSSNDHWNDDAVWALWSNLFWQDLYEPEGGPSWPETDSFWVFADPTGVEVWGGGSDPYGDGWYLYPSGWWNIWFYDHPFDTTRYKFITIEFDATLMDPGQPAWLEFAVNWSTDWWSLEGNPEPEPRVPPIPSELKLGGEAPGEENSKQSGLITAQLTGPGAGPGGSWIWCDKPVTFEMNYLNNTGSNITGMSNGYRVFSPDGALWTPLTYDTSGGIGDFFDMLVSLQGYSITGSGSDTVGLGAVVMLGSGLPNGYDDVVLKIGTQVSASEAGKTLCLDSSFFGAAGTWTWAAPGGGSFTPDWGGQYCWPLVLYPNIEDSAIGRATFIADSDFAGHHKFHFIIPDYNPEWVSIDVMGQNFIIENGVITHECIPKQGDTSLDLSFVITSDTVSEPTGACCYPDGTGGEDGLCVVTTEDSCLNFYGGVYEGDNTSCLGMEACCLPTGECVYADAYCCEVELGGVPQGPGTQCTAPQACCLPGDICDDLDPLCCIDMGGVPQGVGTQCTAPEACCLDDGIVCDNLDPLCCLDLGGEPQGPGTYCLSDLNGNDIDDACEEPLEDHKMHYPQWPDETGWDVYATDPMILADDWECSETGYVKDIHFWGSWKDGIEGEILYFILSIHSDFPGPPYSHPLDLKWERQISDFEEIAIYPDSMEGWYDPETGDYLFDNHQKYYQYNVYLDSLDWFWQDSGTIYWLNISAVTPEVDTALWGWKSSDVHWNDDAVWFDVVNGWQEIYEPPEFYESLDLAFIITGEPPIKPSLWKYHYRGLDYPPFDTCVSGDLTVWGTVDCDTTGHDPLFSDTAWKCVTYSDTIPPWANDLLINFNWHCFCLNKDWAKLTAPVYAGGQWYLQNLHGWYSWHDVEVVELPAIGDPTGSIGEVFYAVNLNTWVADPRPPQEEYNIVDGICPDLPGYLIGTTPIEFTPTAEFRNGPFSTTPLTGSLYWNGEISYEVTGECDCVPGDANDDQDFNLLDILYLIDHLYGTPLGPAPIPYAICSGDPYCDCTVNLLDILQLIDYIYVDPIGSPPNCTCEEWLDTCGGPLQK